MLVDKCLGRRLCTHCKRNYNVADIHIPAQGGKPEVRMPPLQAPPECQPHLIQRTDDNVDTVLHRVKACPSCCPASSASSLALLALLHIAAEQHCSLTSMVPRRRGACVRPTLSCNARVQVYEDEATPVEQFFRQRGLLLDFEITGGIPETLPRLHSTLEPFMSGLKQRHASS